MEKGKGGVKEEIEGERNDGGDEEKLWGWGLVHLGVGGEVQNRVAIENDI